jgi:hypothetical protein
MDPVHSDITSNQGSEGEALYLNVHARWSTPKNNHKQPKSCAKIMDPRAKPSNQLKAREKGRFPYKYMPQE